MNVKSLFVRLIGRLKPVLPQSLAHRVELLRQQVVQPLEPELSALPLVIRRLVVQCEVAVDVGANHGLWTVELARRFKRVIAIEPNPSVAAGLRKVVPGNCTVNECGVSNSSGTLRLHVPSVKGRVLLGWASFESNNCPDADAINDVEVAVRTLDEILAAVTPSFIKMDVEGHEFEAISGSMEVLARARPLLLIEVKKSNEDKLTQLLHSMGYAARSLVEICGIEGTSENRFFVPTEIIPQLTVVQRR